MFGTIVIQANSLGFSTAVIGNEDVIPLRRFKHVFLSDYLDGIVRPAFYDMGSELAALLPEVPAPEFLCPVHASKYRPVQALRRSNPCAVAECLIHLEISEITEIEGTSTFDARCRSDLPFWIPGKEALRFEGLIFSTDRRLHLVSEALIERNVKNEAFLRLSFGELI